VPEAVNYAGLIVLNGLKVDRKGEVGRGKIIASSGLLGADDDNLFKLDL